MFELSRLLKINKNPPSRDKESRVPQLLASNLPPTDDEEITIRIALSEAQNLERELESQLQQLDLPGPSSRRSQVSRFNKTVSRLQSTHETALSYTRILSAHRRIPSEVLILIFNFANDPYILGSWQSRPHLLAFRISQVCRAWRNIALGTPELWTMLHLEVDDGPTALTGLASTIKAKAKGTRNIKSTPYCDFVTELIQRSQQQDLHVYVYARYYQCSDMQTHPILRLLAPHLWRCSSLTIASMKSTVDTMFLSSGWRISPLTPPTDINDPAPQKRIPRLRALKLDLFDWDEVSPWRVLIPQEFLLLRHVELVGIRAESILGLPLEQLHTFKQSSGTSHYSTPVIHTLIPASPNLRTLKLAYQNYNSAQLLVPTATAATQLPAPEITSFELHISPADAPTFSILTHINFSSLLELRVGAFPGDLLKEIILVVTYLRPVNQLSLTKVAFRSKTMKSEILERFLQLTPCLEELDIALPPAKDDNLKCLVSKRLVPRLTVLTIHASSVKNVRAAQGALCAIGASSFSPHPQDAKSYKQAAEKRFKIVLKSLDEACAALTTLNMWHFKESTESQPFLRIAEWRLELSPLVDIITAGDVPKNDRPQISRKLHNLMLEIESFRLSSEQDIVNIFLSKILDPLLTLRRAKDTHFVLYYARKYAFASRVENLLQIWKTDICDHFSQSETNAPFMFESGRVLAYRGSSTESLKNRSIDDLFGTKDDLFKLDWQNYMY